MQPFEAVQAFELRNFPRWVRALEAAANRKPFGLSRWYCGVGMTVYTRSLRASIACSGQRTLVLANIEVVQAYQGQGLFSALVAALVQSAATLEAESLVVESVLSPAFGAALLRRNFQVLGRPGEPCPSYRLALAQTFAPSPAAERLS